MAEIGTRPGGLTALAVINFIFAVFGFMSAAGALLTPLITTKVEEGLEHAERAETRRAAEAATRPETRDDAAASRRREELEEAREAMRMMSSVPYPLLVLVSCVEAGFAILLILSGIGYLKLKRVLGRMLGTVYAIGAIVWAIGGVLYTKEITGQTFRLLSMIGFIYPLLTLFLLRVTFKDDFVNP